jgi:AraC-like DNA-binding protein
MKPSFEKLFPPEGSSIRCFNRAEMEKPVNWHYHPEVELTLVEKGTGTRFVGDNIDNYRDGDLVLLGSNLPHHWSSDEFRGQKYDRHPAVVVQFHRELFGPMLRTPELVEIRELLSRAERGLHVRGRSREIVATTMLQMLHLAPFDRLLRLMRCLQILATTDDVTPLSSEGYSPSFCRKSQERLHRVFDYISENLTNPGLSQAEVAEHANITPAAFCRFFRKATERTVVDFINEQRIAMAARMLVETDLSILTICLNVGFENPSNFNRRFRQFKGMSPRTYRAEFLNLAEPMAMAEN